MNNIFNKRKKKIKIYIFILISFILLILDLFGIFSNIKKNIINKCVFTTYENIYLIKNNIKNIFKILNKNNKLILENELFKNELSLLKTKILLFDHYKDENIKLKKILNIYNFNDNLISSKSIYINDINSIITINKGSKNNISIGQVVVNEYGILGQIAFVGDNFSNVLLTSNRYHYIPVKILRNDIKFILRGSGYKNELYFYNNIDTINNKDIKIGDILVSSGIDNKFPPGYPVATIDNLIIKNNRIYNICIRSIFNNKDIDNVFIINRKNNYE